MGDCMVIYVLNNATERIRGNMTKWMLELKAGVFVGSISKTVRDLLWDLVQEETGSGIMVYSSNNEQGFKMELFGEPYRSVVDIEGIQLISVMKKGV